MSLISSKKPFFADERKLLCETKYIKNTVISFDKSELYIKTIHNARIRAS